MKVGRIDPSPSVLTVSPGGTPAGATGNDKLMGTQTKVSGPPHPSADPIERKHLGEESEHHEGNDLAGIPSKNGGM